MLALSHVVLTTAAIRLAENKKLLRQVDYRWAFLGAVLPDIIDKPLRWMIWHGSLFSGRYIGHTLVFAGVLLGVGLILRSMCNSNRVLVTALGCFMHDVLDAMWFYPGVFLWPVYGRKFQIITHEPRLLSTPYIFKYEFIAGMIITIILMKLIYNKRVAVFLKQGNF